MAKKFTLVLVLAVVAAGWTFAQEGLEGITFGSETKAYFAPLVFITDPQVAGEVRDEDEGRGYVGAGQNHAKSTFSVEGDFTYAGFGLSLAVGAGAGDVSWEGDATAWVTPFGSEILKLQGGGFDEDTLRSKIGGVNGDFHNYFVLPNNYKGIGSGDNGAIFNRFLRRGNFFGRKVGEGPLFVLSSKLLDDSLFVGVGVTAPLFATGNNFDSWSADYDNNGNQNRGPRNAANVYRTTQVGVGYKIDGIGFVRAQFLGGFMKVDWNDRKELTDWYEKAGGGDSEFAPNLNNYGLWAYDKNAVIQAAFALTAVENLDLDLGFTYNLPTTEIYGPGSEAKASNGILVALGAKWKQDAIRVNGRIDFAAGQSFETTNAGADSTIERGSAFGFAIAPAYSIADNTWVGLDFGMGVRGNTVRNGIEDSDRTLDMGFGAFLEKSISKATLTCGVAYALPTRTGGEVGGTASNPAPASGRISVPVLLKVNF